MIQQPAINALPGEEFIILYWYQYGMPLIQRGRPYPPVETSTISLLDCRALRVQFHRGLMRQVGPMVHLASMPHDTAHEFQNAPVNWNACRQIVLAFLGCWMDHRPVASDHPVEFIGLRVPCFMVIEPIEDILGERVQRAERDGSTNLFLKHG